MPKAKDTMSMLLISDSSERAAMLQKALTQQGLSGEILNMRPTRSAVAYARRRGRYRTARQHDFILFDFSEPNERSLETVADIAFGPNRSPSPVILLTSPSSECLLDSDSLQSCAEMFAPTSLSCFLSKMRQHSRRRFLSALAVMSDLGPVLVRLPGFFMHHGGEITVRRVA